MEKKKPSKESPQKPIVEIKEVKQNKLDSKCSKPTPGYFTIGEEASSNPFYRYMGFDVAISCLENDCIRFAEPCTWPDKFESRFYKAKILGKSCSVNNPVMFACCVTNNQNNEAAWKIYTQGATGLASRCVQFKLNGEKFRQALFDAMNGKYELYEGVVQYVYEKDLRFLHLSKIEHEGVYVDNDLHHLFFEDFDFDKYINLLLLKRDAFKHEQEIRFFLKPKGNYQKGKGSYDYVDLNEFKWIDIIEEVFVDSRCSELEMRILKDAMAKKMNVPLKKYYVYGSESDGRELFIRNPKAKVKCHALIADFLVELYDDDSVLIYLLEDNAKAALRDCAIDICFQFDNSKETTQSLGKKLLDAYCEKKSSGNIGEYHIERNSNGSINVYRILSTSMRDALRNVAKNINDFTWEENWTTRQAGAKIVKFANEHPECLPTNDADMNNEPVSIYNYEEY